MEDNPLRRALPPKTDYLSYLTILEYNLTAEQLPVLHDILQDTTLTAHIGWDLVHLLLPLLPASRQCLHDVARLGNPREVVLKATELLEEIATEGAEDAGDEDSEDENQEVEMGHFEERGSHTKGEVPGNEKAEQAPKARNGTSPTQSKILPFTTLLDMLAILHPRIKTKCPSRFLSTSLQAVLLAYSKIIVREGATDAVLGFIKQLSGTKRPMLPPRKSSSRVPSAPTDRAQESAPDPEAQDAADPGEAALQKRLLQSFLSYVAEVYLASTLDSEHDIPVMAWSSRYQEKLHPEKVIPGRRTYSEMFTEEDGLHERDATMGQISVRPPRPLPLHILPLTSQALARDLGTDPAELLHLISNPSPPDLDESNDLPSTPSDVPLSRTGALYLTASLAASSTLYDAPTSIPSSLPFYPSIVNALINSPTSGTLGAEPPAYLDSLFFLGFFILNPLTAISSLDDESFNNSLQRLSMLSANTQYPTLRYHAHQLASRMLHLHPSADVRLAFIRDTLEHCPYENLKASAVGWLKDEILSANNDPKEKKTIFASPALLQILAPSLFPPLAVQANTSENFRAFQMTQVFYLAVLNLLYLLTTSTTISTRLDIGGVMSDCTAQFLSPLLDTSRVFESALLAGELGEDEEGVDHGVAEMKLLQMNVGQVLDAFPKHEGGGDVDKSSP